MSSQPKQMPVLFIPHGGGPWPFMEWNPPGMWDDLAGYLKGVDAAVGQRPKAILVISAHWEERTFTLQTAENPSLIYDYSGFPPHTYQLKYAAPGSPALAQRAAALLGEAGLETATNPTRGYDHGVFIPFMLMYPQADLPIVQLSLLRRLDPETHLAAGRALRALRDEGVLIVASGMSYHNLGAFGREQSAKESRVFDQWLTQTVEEPDVAVRCQRLRDWSSAPAARAVHPREEHLIPLMVAAGAAGTDRGHKVFQGEFYGTRYSGFQFGA